MNLALDFCLPRFFAISYFLVFVIRFENPIAQRER